MSSLSFQASYVSGLFNSSMSTTVWAPFQQPVSADRPQKIWSKEGTVKVTRDVSQWRTKRVTLSCPLLPYVPLPPKSETDTEAIIDPLSIHLELSDDSNTWTPAFESLRSVSPMSEEDYEKETDRELELGLLVT